MLQRTPSRKCKDNPPNGRKNLQMTYPISNYYLDYNNCYSSIIKGQITNSLKWTVELNRHFYKEDEKIANRT